MRTTKAHKEDKEEKQEQEPLAQPQQQRSTRSSSGPRRHAFTISEHKVELQFNGRTGQMITSAVSCERCHRCFAVWRQGERDEVEGMANVIRAHSAEECPGPA